jgi:hypothetical protein
VVTGIINPEAKTLLDSIMARKNSNPAELTPDDPEWADLMKSSAGSPLDRATKDHPATFFNQKPVKASIRQNTDGDNKGMYDAIFTLG